MKMVVCVGKRIISETNSTENIFFGPNVAKKYWEKDYQRDQPHGRSVSWYPGRQKKFEGYYIQGQPHGKDNAWFPDGQIKWEVYHHHGKLHGTSIEWYDNGQKLSEYQNRYGKAHGMYINWDKEGKVTNERYYLNGNEISKYQYINHQSTENLDGLDDGRIG